MSSSDNFDTIDQVLAALYARQPESKIEARLDPTRRLVDLMGSPQANYKIIHITGTNGKTSIARITERLLREHGLRTGRLTSPHLVKFNERIALDGEPVEDQRIIDAFQENLPLIDLVDQELELAGEAALTFFEVFTALAFHVFSDAPIDVLVLEVGIGGLWDATNVADADVAVFGSIALDHQKTLGDTVEEIAETKAGIIKPGSIVVSNSQLASVEAILRRHAENDVFIGDGEFKFSDAEPDGFGTRFTVQGIFSEYPSVWMPIIGQHQAQNATTAIVAVEAFLGRSIADEVLRAALADAITPGRLQVVSKEPLVVLDGAHNPAGLESLREAMNWHFAAPKAIGVVGMVGDKDLVSSAQELAGVFEHLIITSVPGGRGIPASELEAVFTDQGVLVDEIDEDFWSAHSSAVKLGAETNRPVFVSGSLYLVGALLERLQDKDDGEE